MMTMTKRPFYAAVTTPRRSQGQPSRWPSTAWRMPVTVKTWTPGETHWMGAAWTPRTDIVEHEDVY